jgi:hypothetical protein
MDLVGNGSQAIVQDVDRMRAVFQENLRPVNGESIDVRSCELNYVRQSSSRNVLQYTLGIASGTTGQISSQVITGASFGADRTQKQWSRLIASDPDARKAIGPLALPAVTYLPDLDLLLQVFPFDFHLPGLMRLTEGTPELVATLFADVADGHWQIESWTSDIARYRPDMRATIRVELAARASQTGQVETRRAYAKVYRERDEGRQAYRVLQVLWEQTKSGERGFAVARPIAYIDALQTLVMSEVPGERVLQIVRQSKGPDAERAIRRAARAVAGLHQVALPEDLLPQVTKAKHGPLAEVATKLSRNSPEQAATIAALVQSIGQLLHETPLAPTHFDLKQGHMLLDDDRVTILDFDKLAMGDPLVDVANIAATLGAERERTGNRKDRRVGLADAFVEEYFTCVPASWRASFPADFALAALVEAATTGRGRRGRPSLEDRMGRVQSAIEQAQLALSGELW